MSARPLVRHSVARATLGECYCAKCAPTLYPPPPEPFGPVGPRCPVHNVLLRTGRPDAPCYVCVEAARPTRPFALPALRVGDPVVWARTYLASIGARVTDDLRRETGRVVAVDPAPWGRGWVDVDWGDRTQTVAAGNVARPMTARAADVPPAAPDPDALRERP